MRRLTLVALVLVVAGCGGHEQSVPPGAIAVVGDRAITRADFDAELARARRAYSARGRPFPEAGTPAHEQLKDAAVRVLVDRAQLELDAQHAGIVVTAAQIDRRLRRFKQRTFGGDESHYRDQLRRTGLTEADVRRAIRAELLAAALGGVASRPANVVYAPGFEPSGGS
jgi:hypothetical protein